MISTDKLIRLDKDVVKNYHKKMVISLNERGWAVYNTCSNSVYFLCERDIQACVEKGSEKDFLEPNILYTLLPFVENDTSWDEVREAAIKCVNNKRYPFFVDMGSFKEEQDDTNLEDKDNGKVETIRSLGVYLIDCIVFDESDYTWELVVDYDLSSLLGIYQERKGNIELTLSETHKILKQLTKRVRHEDSS